jgi:Ca2+-binding EF-hand superfamily protein
MKRILSTTFAIFSMLAISQVSGAQESAVPEPFRGFDNDSKYVITYDDLTAILKTVVVDVGRSSREVAAPTRAKTGTMMKSKVKRTTSNEANRFYFETFENNDEAKQLLNTIKTSLEILPEEVSLEFFSRDEQLAYWLNLYNVTILTELVEVYPKRNLKKFLTGKKSILSKKLLNVAGVPLSLDDIKFTILKNNYDNNPLIIYGLYQGNIGGPNIRRRAYTGKDVWRALTNNAIEFINSNRGTYGSSKSTSTFQVSSMYERSNVYFPDFNTDLSAHLGEYLEGDEVGMLASATKLKPDIDDWTITSLAGNYREFGGSLADNKAALLDSARSTVPNTNEGESGTLASSIGYGNQAIQAKALTVNRIDPDLLSHLVELNQRRMQQNAINSNVTMEELGENPDAAKANTEAEKKDNN